MQDVVQGWGRVHDSRLHPSLQVSGSQQMRPNKGLCVCVCVRESGHRSCLWTVFMLHRFHVMQVVVLLSEDKQARKTIVYPTPHHNCLRSGCGSTNPLNLHSRGMQHITATASNEVT